MENECIAVQNVKDLQSPGKKWLEETLGRQFQGDQQVFIMVFTPGVVPDEASRQRARAGLERVWTKVDQHVQAHGISDEEFDAAVDEAMDHVRRRGP